MARRLTRNRREAVVGGVGAGFADYFNVDPVLVRLGFVLLAFANGIGLLCYIIYWVIMPTNEAGIQGQTSPGGGVTEEVRAAGEKVVSEVREARESGRGHMIVGIVLYHPGVDASAGSLLLDVPLAVLAPFRQLVASDLRGHRGGVADALPRGAGMSGSRIAWRRVSRGLSFIGFGVFLFLSTQGLVHRGFWMDALAYWPVLLIALGLRVMFDRSKAPWGVLLSSLVIMAPLSFVAWRGPEPPPADWQTVEAVRDPHVETWSLDARMALADLDFRAGSVAPGMLLQGRMAPSNRGSVRLVGRGDSARVSLHDDHWGSPTLSARHAASLGCGRG